MKHNATFLGLGLTLFVLVVGHVTASNAADISLVVVGNPGVGKSFLCNVFLEQEAFKHSFQAGACTIDADSRMAHFETSDGTTTRVVVHNVPGLIEYDPQRLALNKQYINQAFAHPGDHVIMYVFAPGRGGRLEASDFAAYEALSSAYNFQSTSVVFVFNMMPLRDDRTQTYDDEIVAMAMRLINWPSTKVFNYVFLNNDPDVAKSGDFKGAKAAVMRNKLLQSLELAVPHRHEKVKEIELDADRVAHFKQAIGELEQTIAQYRRETEALQGQVAEGQRHNAELAQNVQRLHQEAEQTRRELEEAKKKNKRRGRFRRFLQVVKDVLL